MVGRRKANYQRVDGVSRRCGGVDGTGSRAFSEFPLNRSEKYAQSLAFTGKIGEGCCNQHKDEVRHGREEFDRRQGEAGA
jgi:hypothetical protein